MFTPDELAGIVDLFGALRRSELDEAVSELAYRHGEDPPDVDVDAALEGFVLVELDDADVADGAGEGGADDPLLAPGPAAFPTLPDGAEDLPHILAVETRSVDRERVGRAAEERLRGEAARAVAAGDTDRIADLQDVTYDLEAWAPVDLETLRGRLDDASDGTN